jgi:predicted nucleotidyltransferase
MLSRSVIIDYLKQHKLDFSQKYSINKLGLFGSFATDSNNSNSDIDIVYETSSRGLSFSQLLQFEDELYSVFGKNIDLVNLKYMNPLIKRKALKDIIYV